MIHRKTDADEAFRLRREKARRADKASLTLRHTTSQDLQQKNSMFPMNIREQVQIDWHSAAHGAVVRS